MNEQEARTAVSDILTKRLMSNAVTSLTADNTPATRDSVVAFLKMVRLLRQPTDNEKHEQLASSVMDRLVEEVEAGDRDDEIEELRAAI